MDLTTEKDVVELMESSRTLTKWDDNYDKVKAANYGNIPAFWFRAVILSGVLSRTRRNWI